MSTSKYSQIALTALAPYPNNARTHSDAQIEKIAKSIQEFGFLNPVLINKDNMIIAGHGRVLAAEKLGLKQVPCLRVEHLTETQVKAYILADNKLAEDAGWDMELVSQELTQLKDMDFNIELTGFTLDDIIIDEEPSGIEEDQIPEIEGEPKTKKGDLYQLGNHRLLCGDATSIKDINKLLGDAEIELALTDPPYGISVVSNDGKVGADFGVAKKGNYMQVRADDTTDTAQHNYEIIKDRTNKQIIWGGNYFIQFLPYSDSWVIWDKRGDTGIKNTFADGEMAWCSFHTPVRIYHQLWNGMIREGEHDKRVHPTQKPVRMLSDVLQDFSKENDNIIDCFGGSGSVLMACEQTRRNCFMMEYEPHYIDVIIARWEQLTQRKAVKINE